MWRLGLELWIAFAWLMGDAGLLIVHTALMNE